MTENFAELFEESLHDIEMKPGSIIRATVIDIDAEQVHLEVGLKSEALVPRDEFTNAEGQFDVTVGEEVSVALDAIEDGFGETRLSRERAKRIETWQKLDNARETAAVVQGIISGKVKGGFTVDIENVRAFLPGSLVDVRPVRDLTHLEGKPLDFCVIKLDQKRNNIVVSRRAVIEKENSVERESLLNSLEEGQELKGIVKNLTDYGAFIDLGGIDGLLHITDMSWKRVKHPSELISVGQDVMVKILKFDRERSRVSLGLKQLGDDPWVAIAERYPVGARLTGKVTNLTDYGCFVELEDGIEGLVHVSEMDWTNKNIHPSKVVQPGQEIEVMVLDIDENRRRISLGVKQCRSNPWQDFFEKHEKGEKLSGAIKSITDFGIFIGLPGHIDGLVHLSDISWSQAGEEAIRNYKKGQEVEAIILAIDPERERISLGIKQLEGNPFGSYVEMNTKGSVVIGKVLAVDAKGATIELAEGIEGYLKAAEISSTEKVTDATKALKEGDEVEAKIMTIDRKNQSIALSIKGKDTMTRSETRRRIAEATKAQPDLPSTTLGDLLKEQMGAGLAASAVADDAPASTDGGDAADDEEAEKPADSE